MAYGALTAVLKAGVMEDTRTSRQKVLAYLYLNHRDLWQDSPPGLIRDLTLVLDAEEDGGEACEDLLERFMAIVERYRSPQTGESSQGHIA